MLGFQETLQALFAQFAGVAAHLHAAEGAGVVVGQGIVDPDGAGLNLFKETFSQTSVVGAQAGPQAVVAVIGQFDGLVKVTAY